MSFIQLFGWAGNVLFFSRFFVQWIASERAQRSVAPRAFWWLSLSGAICMSFYLAAQGEFVLLVGVVVNGLIYLRNLMLGQRRETTGSRSAAPQAILVTGAFAAVVCVLLAVSIRMAAARDLSFWLFCSLAGQAPLSLRFVVQWLHAERHGSGQLPPLFWWVSLVGTGFLLAYAIHLRDGVLIAAYLPGPFLQVRNLMLSARREVWAPQAG